jgi:hypothetical protein
MQLETSDFLSRPHPNSVMIYSELHENVIAGDAPFAQIAIEYEIECLAVQYGYRLIEFSEKILGKNFHKALSFIQTHVTLDAEHSETSRIKLESFLEKNPKSLEKLSTVGAASLDIYCDFSRDCLNAAQLHYQAISADKLAIL